jgi:hypothetical protein
MKMGRLHAESWIAAAKGRLIGYVGVHRGKWPDPQLDELRTAGCDPVREEHASGIRPVLTGLPRDIRADETADGQIAAIACARGTACWQRVASGKQIFRGG